MDCPECNTLEAKRVIAMSALFGAMEAQRITLETGKALLPMFVEYLNEVEASANAAMKELAEHRATHGLSTTASA